MNSELILLIETVLSQIYSDRYSAKVTVKTVKFESNDGMR